MGVRTLIVDDHPLTREALTGLLEQQGFSVVGEAADGAEAIDRARALQPDLVLRRRILPTSHAHRVMRCRDRSAIAYDLTSSILTLRYNE